MSQGYTAVDNNASHFYLTGPGGVYPGGWGNFYYEIGAGLTPAERALMQGGEMSQVRGGGRGAGHFSRPEQELRFSRPASTRTPCSH